MHAFFHFFFSSYFLFLNLFFVRKSGAAHPTVRVCYTYKFFSIDNNRKSIYKYGFFSPPSSVSTNCSGVDRKPSWLCEYALNLIMCVKIRDMYVRQSLSWFKCSPPPPPANEKCDIKFIAVIITQPYIWG